VLAPFALVKPIRNPVYSFVELLHQLSGVAYRNWFQDRFNKSEADYGIEYDMKVKVFH